MINQIIEIVDLKELRELKLEGLIGRMGVSSNRLTNRKERIRDTL